jgi:hypothetical protein
MQDLSQYRSLRRRWQDYRATKAHAFWIGVACIAGTLIAGFGTGGWVTGGTARMMASDAATDARQQLAAAVCVEEFMAAANAGARLEKLRDSAWYQRADVVAAGGWATMPDKTEPNSAVAYACAEKLVQLKPPASASAAQAGTTLAR